MEYRKIIGFGKSSFVVSLPKDWVTRNNLKKGSAISISEENESIVISPTPVKNSKEAESTKIIDTKSKSNKFLQRELISSYISGYDTIIIKGDDLKSRRKAINEVFRNLVALEIIKQDEESIIAKDFLDINDINLHELMRKIDNNLRSMIIEFVEMVDLKIKSKITAEQKRDLLRLMGERDDSINKLTFLSFRSIKDMLMNPSKTRESMIELFQAWTTVLYIERAGDEIKRIYRNLLESEQNTKELSELKSMFEDAGELYKGVMKIFYENEKSVKKGKNYELAERCRLFQKKCKVRIQKGNGTSKHMIPAYEKLINFTSYLEEILRLTYDFLWTIK